MRTPIADGIPDGWTIASLRDTCDLRREHVDPTATDAAVYVGLEHIEPGNPRLNAHGSPTQVRSAKSRFHVGDLLYGKLRPYLDNAVLADREGICSTDILVLEPNRNQSTGQFLINVLHKPDFIQHAVRTTHGVNHPRTSWQSIREFQLPLPPLDEQRAIAGVLGKIQAAVAAQQAIIDRTAELKAALMAKLFTEGTRGEATNESPIGPIPESWAVVTLDSVCERMNYGTSVRCSVTPTGLPVLRIPNVIGERIDTAELKYADLPARERDNLLLEPGDLLFIRTNGNRFYTGRSAVYEGVPDRSLFASYIIRVRLSPAASLLPQFVQAFLSSIGRDQITSRANSASDGKWNIDTGVLRSLLLPQPDEVEQRAILSAINAVDDRKDAAERAANAYRELFSAMLDELMTGRIRVNGLGLGNQSP
jgi:type I restriction enzyme S subunit